MDRLILVLSSCLGACFILNGELAKLLQSHLFEGRLRVRLLEKEQSPPEGFDPVEATLEDAYMAVMLNGRELLPILKPCAAGEAAVDVEEVVGAS